MASKARQLAQSASAPDGRKNMVINGAMQVAQRSTSVSSQTTGGYKTVDRWLANASGSTFNQSQQTVPLGDSTVGDFKYFLRTEITTGDDNAGLLYRIEDVQSVPEGTVTVSFYAKGTNPNSGHIEFIARQDFGTGGSPSSTVSQTAQDVTLTSSWQRFSLQITVPSISGKTLGTNGDSFYQLRFTQPSDDDNSAAWTLDITGVQLEVGSVATEFEHRSFAEELALCQRYYQKFEGTTTNYESITVGYNQGTGNHVGVLYTNVPIRSNGVAVETTGTASDYVILHQSQVQNLTSVPVLYAYATVPQNDEIVNLTFTGTTGSGLTAEGGSILSFTNSAGKTLALEDEL